MRKSPFHVTQAGLWIAALTLAACKEADSPTATSPFPGRPTFTVGSGIAVTPLARGTIDPFHIQSFYEGHLTVLQSPQASDIVVNSATLAAGGTTGWHSHPGPVVVTIKTGALTIYDAGDCRPVLHPAGTAFIEPGGSKDIHVGRNEGATPVEWVATLFVGVGVTTRIDAPAPANCPH